MHIKSTLKGSMVLLLPMASCRRCKLLAAIWSCLNGRESLFAEAQNISQIKLNRWHSMLHHNWLTLALIRTFTKQRITEFNIECDTVNELHLKIKLCRSIGFAAASKPFFLRPDQISLDSIHYSLPIFCTHKHNWNFKLPKKNFSYKN